MNSGEFHAHVVKIVKRCKFQCTKAEERAIRDTILLGMNSTKARDKTINLMNEELEMQELEIEDCKARHKSLSQLDSITSINFAAYDHRQNKGKNSKKNRGNGKDRGQNNTGAQGSSNSSHQSRKLPGMENKCMRCGKHEHELDIFTKCARARREPPREPTLFKPPKMMMTPTLMKMESDNQTRLQG